MKWITALGVLCCLPTLSFAQADTLFKRFSLTQTDEGVLIDFTMFAGATCNGIRLERSIDSTTITNLHEFVGVCGSTGGETTYQFTDTDPIRNRNSYYRLDAGLQGLYSAWQSIRYIAYGAGGLTVYPNPCNNPCTWYIDNPTSKTFDCFLMDAAGRVVVQETIRGNIWQPETYALANGFYTYQIRYLNEPKYLGKILINKP